MRFSRYVCASAFASANGDGEIRTLDPLLARQVLSQLSYTPMDAGLSFRTSLPVFSFVYSLSGLGLSEPFPISLRLWMNFTCFSLLGVGLSGLEPPTSRLSGVRSNQLSYRPINKKERVTRIELATTAWKAVVLPLNYTRLTTKWRETESNRRHMELQSIALPTELPSQIAGAGFEPTTFGL